MKEASPSNATLHRHLKLDLLALAALNGLATAYYINYIFFYMEKQFGQDKSQNLLLGAFYGFTYLFAASSYGKLAHRFGYFPMLRVGLLGMTVALLIGGILPLISGYPHQAIYAQFVVLMMWTITTSFTWPTLQALLSRESPSELPRLVGIYNLLWAGGGAVSQFTGGALFDHVSREFLFWVPVALNVTQLFIVARLEIMTAKAGPPPVVAVTASESLPPPNPRSTAKSRSFLRLAWAANPFAYIAVYGFVPVIPQLSQKLHLTTTAAGFIFSVWFWARLAAFLWFWKWPGWHYRFRWLVTAFLAMIASFILILVSPSVWLLVLAQIAFGLSIGLIYYSSLYYSMDVGASKGKRGGIHEAVIGFGIGAGPAIGYGAIRLFPATQNAIAWNVGGMLVLGFLLFLFIRVKWWEDNA
jgi:MFS family permease